MSPLALLREFHEAFGHPVADRLVRLPKLSERKLRATLIDEEAEEALAELEAKASEFDPAKLAKELADLVYVVYGTAVAFGIDLDAVVAEVHASNMSKLGPDGEPIYREDGKVLKGPNYRAADVEAVLA